MKNLHIMLNKAQITNYINFINENFNEEEHVFLVRGGEYNKKIKNKRVIEIKRIKKNRFMQILVYSIAIQRVLYKGEKIHLHGLFNPIIVFLLFFQPWLLKKCNWIIWGGDLYSDKRRNKSLMTKIYEEMKKSCISKMNGFITSIEGDYDLAKKWYNVKGKYYDCIAYTSNIYVEKKQIKREEEKTIYIQVGNSADPENNHEEILDDLEKYKNEDIKIICPLSYGSEATQAKITKIGKEKFGEKFIPLVEFLELEEYFRILMRIDIAAFNHDRQQALGNITTLIGHGKKVYIKSDISTWKTLIKKEMKIFDIKKGIDLELLSDFEKESNKKKIKKYYSKEKLKEDWEKIFND